MISGYCVVQGLPRPLNVIHPRRVNGLINHPELRILFKPALSFPTLVDNVVINDERDRFVPAVTRLQVFKQTDKQHRTFAVAPNIADFPCAAVQRSGQIVFFVLSRRHHAFLLPA